MADVEFAPGRIFGPRMSHQVGDEFVEVVATGATVAGQACAILDEGSSFDIEIEVPGWTERVVVRSPARPGEVRGAVEKVLRDLGLTTG